MYLSCEMPPEAWSEERRLYLQATLCQMKWFFMESIGAIIIFSHKKGAIIPGKAKTACISNFAHWKASPKYFVSLSH